MKRRLFITVVALLIIPALSYAQLLFTLDDTGHFIAEDGKGYYVFEIPDASQEELEKKIFGRITEMMNEPRYFEYPDFKCDADGNVTYRHQGFINYKTLKHQWYGVLDYYYSFSIQCKEGRFRINAPSLNQVIQGNGNAKWYPEEWIRDRQFGKVGDRNWSQVSAEQLFNKAIAVFLLYVWREEAVKFDNRIILSSPDEELYTIIQNAPNTTPVFKYKPKDINKSEDIMGQYYLNLSMPGLSKDKIIDVLYEGLRTEYRGMNTFGFNHGDINKYQDGITIDSSIKLDVSEESIESILGVLASRGTRYDNYEFDYSTVIVCEDEVVQVWVPKITHVKRIDASSAHYEDFLDFCRGENHLSLSGSLKQTERTRNLINRLTQTLNKQIWTPLYAFQQAILNPKPPVEEKEEKEEEW